MNAVTDFQGLAQLIHATHEAVYTSEAIHAKWPAVAAYPHMLALREHEQGKPGLHVIVAMDHPILGPQSVGVTYGPGVVADLRHMTIEDAMNRLVERLDRIFAKLDTVLRERGAAQWN
jgi:hypothetical protein